MSDGLLVRIVASRPVAEGMLPDEVVASLRIAPAVIESADGREAFLGLVLEGADKVHEAMRDRRWIG